MPPFCSTDGELDSFTWLNPLWVIQQKESGFVATESVAQSVEESMGMHARVQSSIDKLSDLFAPFSAS